MRRRRLIGIAHDVIYSFASRSNDVGGYWALGKLYQLAQSSGNNFVSIDLVNREIRPNSPEFLGMIRKYADLLAEALAKRYPKEEQFKKASIGISFNEVPLRPIGNLETEKVGDPYKCRMDIIDELDRQYTFEVNGFCWPHNPTKESRSTRPNIRET